MTRRPTPAAPDAVHPPSEPESADAVRRLAELVRHYPQRFEAGVALDTLDAWPRNPKDHDVGAIVESMQANGIIGVLYVQTASRRILAGHGRKEALTALDVARMDCVFVDCPDDVAERFVLADNRVNERGGYNEPALYDYLRTMLDDGRTLGGTGYDVDDVDRLHFLLDGVSFAPAQDRASDSDESYASHTVTVRCQNVEHTQAVTAAIATLLTAHPDWNAHIAAR